MTAANRRSLALIAVLMLLAIGARALPGPRTIDDAFITFRYSRNLVEGAGFVYNPGVRTLGTTTPLFALTMAGMSGLAGGQDFPHYALWVSALADAGTVSLMFVLARRLTGSPLIAVLPAAIWAIAPMSVTFAIGGMETSVTIFWMFAAFALYARPGAADDTPRRAFALGAVAGLGLLTRVDSALWIGPLFAYQLAESWLRARRLPWRTWAGVLLILLPWLVFSWAYFGALLPNSVTAKRFAYVLEPFSALGQLLPVYSNVFSIFDVLGSTGAMISAVIHAALALCALPYAARRLPRALPLLVYPWLYFAVFAALNPLIFRWYFAPPLPAWILAIFTGAWALLAPLAQRGVQGRRVALGLVAALGLFWLFTTANGWVLRPDHGPDRPAPRMAWHQIELLYEQMGRHLRDVIGVTAETRVASGDIGAIGFFSRATIVDTVGLVTPELTAYYPVDPALIVPGQNYAIPPALIADTLPDYLVTMEAFVRLGLEAEPWFNAQYDLILEYPTDFYGTGMRLYRRR